MPDIRLNPGDMARLIDGGAVTRGQLAITGSVPDWACEVACCNCGNDIVPHHLCTDCLEEMSGVVHEEA